MNFLDFIARIIEALFAWLPRPVLITQNNILALWTLKRNPVLRQGLVWVIPLIHEYEIVDMRVNAYEFEPKILWTKDGREVAVGMVVLWRPTDPLKLFTQVDDLGGIVGKLGESVLPELVGAFTLEELKRKAAGGEGREWGFDAHLRRALDVCFAPYGLSVERARLNFTSDRVRTFKLIQGGA